MYNSAKFSESGDDLILYFTGLQWSFLFSLSMAPLQSSHRDWKHGVPGTLISFSLVLSVLCTDSFFFGSVSTM